VHRLLAQYSDLHGRTMPADNEFVRRPPAHCIRANVIMPGLINTPMAIETCVAGGFIGGEWLSVDGRQSAVIG
jgi:NAD(P)-dependent dehydrogenase (short-subunit alcohol dehydrogenase family)